MSKQREVTDADLERIPKFIADEFRWQARKVKELETHITDISDPNPGSNVAVGQHGVYPDVTLPSFSEILFFLGDDRDPWRNTVTFRIARSKPYMIDIRASDNKLFIQPASYNAVELGLRDF